MQPPKSETDMGWGPEYGPWTYTPMSEPFLSSELARLSAATSLGSLNTNCVTFQPCPNPEQSSQDRYVVADWKLHNGTWKFLGIFDGHAGHNTVDYVVEALPAIIEASLQSAFADTGNTSLDPTSVSGLLIDGISTLDESISQDLRDLFPGGPDAIANMSDGEIRAIINDSDSGGQNSAKLMRCMRGSTVLVSLIDPTGENLWVASLGDCQAVLGVKHTTDEWDASLLSANHNGADEAEAQRVRNEHPGEEGAIVDHRVLGAIAITRAVGDHLFKFPAIYTERIFKNAKPGFRFSTKVEDFLQRNLTPPYLSNRAEVRHVCLKSSQTMESCLIMCSDGLMDLYEDFDRDLNALAKRWVQVAVSDGAEKGNRALHLLRDALGGVNEDQVSRMMTVEMFERWMDDTTILVQWL